MVTIAETSYFIMALLFVFIYFTTMFHCTVHLQGPKGERGDTFPPGLGVRGLPGDAGSPGLPGELVSR
jgi:hypothetical protein